MKFKVAIIGAGPAGISAGIQLARYGIDYVIFEKYLPGGLIINANLIENYIGFPNGITGIGFSKLLHEHISKYKMKIIYEKVKQVKFINNKFSITTNKKKYLSDYLISASGTTPKKSFENLDEKISRRIFYDIFHLLIMSKKKIAIIGGGDAAFDYALNLSKKNNVIILNRTNKIKSLDLLIKRVFKNKNIKYYSDTELQSLEFKNGKLILNCRRKKLSVRFECDYLVPAIGRKPDLDYFDSEFKTEILQKSNRLFFAGDVKNGIYRQASIAVGDGIFAAMKIYRQINKL